MLYLHTQVDRFMSFNEIVKQQHIQIDKTNQHIEKLMTVILSVYIDFLLMFQLILKPIFFINVLVESRCRLDRLCM